MKAIILVSSIFYLLGLKISNNVDFIKKDTIAPVVNNKPDYPEKPGVNARFHDRIKSDENTTGIDSLHITQNSYLKTTINKEKM